MNKFYLVYKLFMIFVSCEFGGLFYDIVYIFFKMMILFIMDVLYVVSEFFF